MASRSSEPLIRSGLSVPTHLMPPPSQSTAFSASATPQESSTVRAIDATKTTVLCIPFTLRWWGGDRRASNPRPCLLDWINYGDVGGANASPIWAIFSVARALLDLARFQSKDPPLGRTESREPTEGPPACTREVQIVRMGSRLIRRWLLHMRCRRVGDLGDVACAGRGIVEAGVGPVSVGARLDGLDVDLDRDRPVGAQGTQAAGHDPVFYATAAGDFPAGARSDEPDLRWQGIPHPNPLGAGGTVVRDLDGEGLPLANLNGPGVDRLIDVEVHESRLQGPGRAATQDHQQRAHRRERPRHQHSHPGPRPPSGRGVRHGVLRSSAGRSGSPP